MGICDWSAADRRTAGAIRVYRLWHGERTISASGAGHQDRLHGAATLAAVMPMESETCCSRRPLSVNLAVPCASRPTRRARIASDDGSIPAKNAQIGPPPSEPWIPAPVTAPPEDAALRKGIRERRGVEAAVSAALPASAVSAALPWLLRHHHRLRPPSSANRRRLAHALLQEKLGSAFRPASAYSAASPKKRGRTGFDC